MPSQLPSTSKLDIIYRSLEQKILDGVWAVGAQMPTEIELSNEFACHRSTISKALTRLAHEGLVERRRRSGTKVVRNTPLSSTSVHLDAFAFIYPCDKHEGAWRSAKGFQDAASEMGRRSMLLTTNVNLDAESEILMRLQEFDVKGAAIFPVVMGPKHRLAFTELLQKSSFPIVLAQTAFPDLGLPTVVFDGLHAGAETTHYLLQKGIQKVGFLGNFGWSPTVREKHLGYRQAMMNAGLEAICAEYSYLELEMHPDFNDVLAESQGISQKYLRKHPDVQGVVCANDYMALALIQEAQAIGLRVPEDLKVIGIDDFAVSSAAPIPLTTYHVPYEAIGRLAFETLQKILLQPKSEEVIEIPVRGEIVVRQSA